jgi:hypothetical protein
VGGACSGHNFAATTSTKMDAVAESGAGGGMFRPSAAVMVRAWVSVDIWIGVGVGP